MKLTNDQSRLNRDQVKHGDKPKLLLKLRGKAGVFIDWANVYGWSNRLKKQVDPHKLYRYLKESLNIIKHLETKDIEKILQILNRKVLRRKCDFDMEIAIDCFENLEKYGSYIFFSGDGDFEPLYKMLIGLRKQVIVIYAQGHLGREVWNLKRGIFKTEIVRMDVF